MRPDPAYHVEWVEDEAVILDTRTQELHYLNAPAAYVYALILEHGFERAMADLRNRFDENTEFGRELPRLVDDMHERGLLIDG